MLYNYCNIISRILWRFNNKKLQWCLLLHNPMPTRMWSYFTCLQTRRSHWPLQQFNDNVYIQLLFKTNSKEGFAASFGMSSKVDRWWYAIYFIQSIHIPLRKDSVRKRYYPYVLYFQLKDILRGKNLYGQQKIYQSIYHTMGGVSNRMNGKKHV